MFKLLLIFIFLLLVLSVIQNARKFGFRVYVTRVLIGLDQWFNTLIGGMPDETISSRCARGSKSHWYWKVLAFFLDIIDKNHTRDALQSEYERRHAPESLR